MINGFDLQDLLSYTGMLTGLRYPLKKVKPFLDFYVQMDEIRTQLLPCSNIVVSCVLFAAIGMCYSYKVHI